MREKRPSPAPESKKAPPKAALFSSLLFRRRIFGAESPGALRTLERS
ncbi:MAG: hypothetical protein HSCHL_1758 [Hydrogenibacillus schlegelii]|uniref:Uncharacterized protein n=1 Tax=Hydrogenibacillus schlegelii TaxID=1484 RepID=A0A2T5G4C5_HYDSH|nr:MAG: hypothetical protein HSCHL_1758 [Hydrogenibacillus schlegelii]